MAAPRCRGAPVADAFSFGRVAARFDIAAPTVRTAGAHARRRSGAGPAGRGRGSAGRTVPGQDELVGATPFVRFVRLRGPATSRRGSAGHAPHSGYIAAVGSPPVKMLLTLGEVVVTDWTDGRMIPPVAGAFGLPEQVAAGLETASHLQAEAHLVAVSQSSPAALAAAALLAARSADLAPSSLVFLGCRLDPRVSPTPLQQVLAQWPSELLRACLTANVVADYPGSGRRVYPSLLQLLAYGMSSPGLYAEVQQALLRELTVGRTGDFDRQHADIHSLLDVPASCLCTCWAGRWMARPGSATCRCWRGGQQWHLAPMRHPDADPGGRRRRARGSRRDARTRQPAPDGATLHCLESASSRPVHGLGVRQSSCASAPTLQYRARRLVRSAAW